MNKITKRVGRLGSMVMLMLALGSLGGCVPFARPAQQEAMTASMQGGFVEPPAELKNAVVLGAVTGGEPTNPMWVSNVGNNEFAMALDASLRNFGLVATGQPRYRLNADLVGVERPIGGFDLTVTSTVNYQLEPVGPGRRFATSVVAPYTATFGQAYAAIDRIRIGEEGSIRANIQEFMRQAFAFFAKP